MPIAPAVAHEGETDPLQQAASLARELESLQDCKLLEASLFTVYLAPAPRIPRLLVEIGRLRSEASPDAESREGLDLDRYDDSYLHLFVWDHGADRLAGAYRLGCTDLLGAAHRPAALYTHSLFDYDERLLRRLGPALELGRSFVRPEYQRSSVVLHLLWQGIGRFAVTHPRYRYLFGALTIDHRFSAAGRDVLLDYLTERSGDQWRGLARGRSPVRAEGTSPLPTGCGDLRELTAHFERLEGGAHRVPVLLRHYVRLGAKTLDFSLDDGFGGSVDALIVVDLADSPRRILERYLGPQGAETFLAYHDASSCAS